MSLAQQRPAPGRITVAGAPEGFDALVIAKGARARGGLHLHIARDDARASQLAETLAFFDPQLPVLHFPAWDCLPYDRMSPKPEIAGERMAALAALATRKSNDPLIVITTVNAALQRVPPRAAVTGSSATLRKGERVPLEGLVENLSRNGFSRASAVMEPGDFAVRGGIVDIFPAGAERPARLDLFGDTLESIRLFNPDDQRSTGEATSLLLTPVSEALLDKPSIQRFRTGYIAAFGAVLNDDPLYEAISAGRKQQGMEHWLPLFHSGLETIFEYVGGAAVTLDHQTDETHVARLALIADYYDARVQARAQPKTGLSSGVPPYKPLPPASLYLTEEEWRARLGERRTQQMSPFKAPEMSGTEDAGAVRGRDFAPERVQGSLNVFDSVASHIRYLQEKRNVMVACWSAGSADRMGGVLADHGVAPITPAANFADAQKLHRSAVAVVVLPAEYGFEAPGFAVITEQDILGDRLVRSRPGRKRAANFIAEAAALSTEDLVVHVDHGIGRYLGLKTIEAAGAPHDCLEIQYDGGKLFLPVENIELLSRYGSDSEGVELDRLGGAGWQARKAKLKNRIRDMAAQLIKVAAERELRTGPVIDAPQGVFEEFCARFPYEETEDQEKAIADVLEDLSRGRPMDRLICGDVGFGKTEVALRAAFIVAMTGRQVAVVVPTTLLARQHFKTFRDRFAGWPVKLRQLSRLVTAKEASETKASLKDGEIDLVVGTHALLAKSIEFRDLGLLVVDEEQHFGVAHKERLKQLRSEVHVLTLTATPIPRTLQLALSGVKELSIIATPPVDRLAVRTFVGPFDPVTVREALLREHYRGGQSFYVCPRISDLAEAEEFLKATVPEVKIAQAHGQMPPTRLEDIMSAFYDGQFDVLLSTPIVESGLDIPTANTMIIHRADMFGLAALYQLRGRIGRSKARAYAYLTVPPNRTLTANADRRLKVLQALDSLGAGFSLASHDLDIRGAGNLLGEEQSGQVREVGIELYQDMLEEAVASLRGTIAAESDGAWSPQINVGTAVLIPESFVTDLNVRLALYRRLSEIEDDAAIESFAAELIDRFGPLPAEVHTLLKIVSIKRMCRLARVEKIDAGPKGAVIAFRKNEFPKPEKLIGWLSAHPSLAKVRPDQKLSFSRTWATPEERLAGVHQIMSKLAELAR